jgi:TRAP-type uncharacterized transport system fused permease subunit
MQAVVFSLLFTKLWSLGALASMGYLIHQYDVIMTVRGGIPNNADIVMAIITV